VINWSEERSTHHTKLAQDKLLRQAKYFYKRFPKYFNLHIKLDTAKVTPFAKQKESIAGFLHFLFTNKHLCPVMTGFFIPYTNMCKVIA
jgi:hypothetical protein